MTASVIHPNWNKPLVRITDGFSLEVTAKEKGSLLDAAPLIPPETPVSVAFLPGEHMAARIEAAVAVRELGRESQMTGSKRALRPDHLGTDLRSQSRRC
jgi:methylenetetrahydrofolate reductase (NADPH)